MSTYKPGEFEDKWEKVYSEKKTFEPGVDTKKKKFFITVPVPYPDGRLHLGHLYTWTRADVYARFMRMKGFNVLWPQSWHFTGGPMMGMSIRLKNKDPVAISIMQKAGVSPSEMEKFTDPLEMGLYFSKTFKNDMQKAGMSIDWRREFILSYTPHYSKFVEWQLRKLKDKGLIVQGNHPVVWCPREDTPLGDHDRAEGEGESPMLFSIIKFKHDDIVLPVATLRPETVFGATNLWVNKQISYRIIQIRGEKWIVSQEFAKKAEYQFKDIKDQGEFDIGSLLGKNAVNPVNGEELTILNADFVDKDVNTGLVMSVPMHAPFDYFYWEKIKTESPELYRKPKKVIDVLGQESLIEEAVKKAGGQANGLKEATRFVYKKETNDGILNSNSGELSGLAVKQGKEKAIDILKGLSAYDSFYEVSGKVVCRCGSRGLVKLVENQWFIRYSDKELKEKAIAYIEKMNIFPPEAKAQVINSIYNMEDKAMARRGGLGTPLPWNKDWIMEPLSDSTIYMAFYTISHIIKDIDVKEVNDELFDYVFFGVDTKKKPSKKMEDMRREFEYWYPVNLRVTAKDLLTNHLIFFILNHVALFPEDKWPRGLGVNGWLIINDIKMAKSKGNALTISESVEEHGADAVRLIAAASNGIDDVKWSLSDISAAKQRFEVMMDAVEILNDIDNKKSEIDRFLMSRMNYMIKAAEENYSEMKFRNAVFSSFFEGIDNLKFYLDAGGRDEETLRKYINGMVRLIHPVFPFITEEINKKLGGKNLLEESGWPDAGSYKQDEVIENEVSALKSTMEDISKLIKITEKKPSKIVIGIAGKELFDVYNSVVEAAKKTQNPKEIRGVLKTSGEFVEKLLKNPNRIPKNGLDRETEIKLFEELKGYIKRLFGAEIEIKESDDEKAAPGRPKIDLL